jgi:MYND finger
VSDGERIKETKILNSIFFLFLKKIEIMSEKNLNELLAKINHIVSKGHKHIHCAACGGSPTEKTNLCGGCMMVHYCSKECQQNHWTEHKKECL